MRRIAMVGALLVVVASAAGCAQETPAGPTAIVNGNGNNVNQPSGGTGNTQTTPAPVVVTPVFAPEGEAE